MAASGVTPSMFGAFNLIDGALWKNGIFLHSGRPVVARVEGSVGVAGLLTAREPGGDALPRVRPTGRSAPPPPVHGEPPP